MPRDCLHGTQMKIFIKGKSLFLQFWEIKQCCFKDICVLKCMRCQRFDFHFLQIFFSLWKWGQRFSRSDKERFINLVCLCIVCFQTAGI